MVTMNDNFLIYWMLNITIQWLAISSILIPFSGIEGREQSSSSTPPTLALPSTSSPGPPVATTLRTFSPETAQLIHTWAPLVYLHSEEQFMPSSVDYFLEHVNVQTRKGRVLEPQPSPSKLPAGQASAGLHLQSRAKLTCSSCLGPTFFYGNSVLKGGVPVYAIVRDYQDAWNTIDVVYHMFYPYNRGKQVCLGIATGKDKENCLGNVESFGNHVGDWEHATLRFQNGKPHTLYLSVHNFGAYYVWNETAGVFHLHKGESPKQKAARRGRKRKFARDLVINFPPVLQLSGTHPILYSANGSHGLWASSGKHTYSPFPLLEDFTDSGIAWNTWDNLIVIPWNDSPYPYVGQLGWLNFRGEWGNAKSGCDLEPLSGECRLNHGPVFPGGPDDMPPPRIQRSRYVTATGATSVVSTPAPYYYVIKLQERSPTRPTPPNYRYKRRNNEQESLFHEPNVDISTL